MYLPPGYQPGQTWPVILALGEAPRGAEGPRAPRGLMDVVRIHPERYPAVVVMLQCPPAGDVSEVAVQALESTFREFGGDRKRVYLAGQSQGAQGAMQLAALYPGRFAAVVAVSGRYTDRSMAKNLKGQRVWVWHGDADKEVPVSEIRSLVAQLREAGSATLYTELSGLGHDISDTVYLDTAVSDWLFKQQK